MLTIFAWLWPIWLIGLLVCGGLWLYKWASGFVKTGGTIYKAANLTMEGVEVAADGEKTVSEKVGHARKRVVEEVAAESYDRAKGFVVGGAAMIGAIFFGFMLLASIAAGIIDYFV